uniref:Putative secreted protein n=1 Tax=Anopheles marajoara TaxID=58244 RepID=A0A2M4CEJ5_9DIPT
MKPVLLASKVCAILSLSLGCLYSRMQMTPENHVSATQMYCCYKCNSCMHTVRSFVWRKIYGERCEFRAQ